MHGRPQETHVTYSHRSVHVRCGGAKIKGITVLGKIVFRKLRDLDVAVLGGYAVLRTVHQFSGAKKMVLEDRLSFEHLEQVFVIEKMPPNAMRGVGGAGS